MDAERIKWLHTRAEEMRANPTFYEQQFAERLQSVGIAFESQVVIVPYIVDFLLPGRLIVEIDGKIHLDQKQYDARRDKYLKQRSYRLKRVLNENVLSCNLEQLLDVKSLTPVIGKPVIGKRRQSAQARKKEKQKRRKRSGASKRRTAMRLLECTRWKTIFSK